MSDTTTLVYTDVDFRKQFPAYADTTVYPEATLQQAFDTATNFVSNYNVGSFRDSQRQMALYLMTSHLLQIASLAKANAATGGALAGMQTSAKIRDVSISWQVPAARSQWAWWLGQTGDGQTLLALLRTASAGGFYLGGSPAGQGFRRATGGFRQGF